jgi:hypothetical protein
VSKYIGIKTKIAEIEEYKGRYGYFIKIISDVVDTLPEIIDTKTNKPLELKASKIFGLFEDKNGTIGWNENTALGIFLKKWA